MTPKTPKPKKLDAKYIQSLIGQNEIIQEGLILCDLNDNKFYDIIDKWDDEANMYGVSDTPEQALEYVNNQLKEVDGNFCVFTTHIEKDPTEEYGWRWHKWGEYIGDGEPTEEYLAHEKEFDEGVYTFHSFRVEN